MALYRLLYQLKLRGDYQLSVSCLYNGDGVVAQKIRSLGIEVHDWGMRQQKWRVDAFGRFFTYLKTTNPDVLHTWMFHSNIPGRIIGRAAKVPVIVSGERTMGQESTNRHRLNRMTARYAHAITCVSKQVATAARDTIGLPANKLTVIPNGLDLALYKSLPDQTTARANFDLPFERPLIGVVGRPRPVKGYNYLLDGLPQVLETFSTATIVFVGDGPSRPALEAQARGHNSAENTIFIGDCATIPQLLPAFDMLVLPSLQEGMPNVALEAMAAGLPVIATAVGGTPEVVVPNKTGLLVPSKNPTALANAIIQLLADPTLAQQMGRNGRQRVAQKFSIETTVEHTHTLYQTLTEQYQHTCRSIA